MLIYPSRECLTGNLLIEEICLRIYLTKLTEEIHVILHAQQYNIRLKVVNIENSIHQDYSSKENKVETCSS
jgi:hypothetical protein